MIKIYHFLLLNIFLVFICHAQDIRKFADAAGKPGSTAISKDSNVFVGWATEVEIIRGYINILDTTATYNATNKASFGVPHSALGKAEGNGIDVVSLGDSGYAILKFKNPITNGPGYDFAVFENGFSDSYLELGFVEVSSDGENYYRFPSISLTSNATQIGGFGALDPTKIHNLAGKYRQGFGTPFDLEELTLTDGLDVNKITHVKIVDAVGSIHHSSSKDAEGNIVNDLFPTPFHNGGFDLDAVGVIHEWVLSGIDNRAASDIKIYPNPVRDLVFIEGTKGKKINYEIIDLTGKILITGDTNGNLLFSKQEVRLNAGIYQLKVYSNQNITSALLTLE